MLLLHFAVVAVVAAVLNASVVAVAAAFAATGACWQFLL